MEIPVAIQKTAILMALTCFDTVNQQTASTMSEVFSNSKTKYRLSAVETRLERCYGYCRALSNFTLAVPAQKSVAGFCARFAKAVDVWHATTEEAPEGVDAYHMLIILSEAANTLLYDLPAVAPVMRGDDDFHWLRQHHTTFLEMHYERMTIDVRDWCQEQATQIYCDVSDSLKSENHRDVWKYV